MSEGTTSTPFKNQRLNRWNDFASKFDTPLATFLFRILSTAGAGLFVVGCYAGQQWLAGMVDQIVAKNPVVYNVGTRIDENTKRTIELAARADDTFERVKTNERAIATITLTQSKIQDFLRQSLDKQQEISVKISTLSQKVDDGQQRAQDAEKRLDNRLDTLARNR